MRKILLTATAIVAFSSSAFAAGNQASVNNATATATVVTPISLEETTPMAFGTFASGDAAGTVSTNGTYINVTKVPGLSANAAPAQFTVGGEGNYGYNITYSNVDTALKMTKNSTDYTMGFTLDTNNPITGTLTSGAATFNVNATIDVAAGQESGTYTGNYDVTVQYQ